MTAPTSSYAAVSDLRVSIAALEEEISGLLGEAREESHAARANKILVAWVAVARHLDLGEEPSVRPCPRCAASCRSNATRCGHCWAKLDALPEQAG